MLSVIEAAAEPRPPRRRPVEFEGILAGLGLPVVHETRGLPFCLLPRKALADGGLDVWSKVGWNPHPTVRPSRRRGILFFSSYLFGRRTIFCAHKCVANRCRRLQTFATVCNLIVFPLMPASASLLATLFLFFLLGSFERTDGFQDQLRTGISTHEWLKDCAQFHALDFTASAEMKGEQTAFNARNSQAVLDCPQDINRLMPPILLRKTGGSRHTHAAQRAIASKAVRRDCRS